MDRIKSRYKIIGKILHCINSAKSSSKTGVSLKWGSQEGSRSHNCVIFSKANHRSRVDIPLAPLGYRELSLLAKAKKARRSRRGKLWSLSPLLLQSGTKCSQSKLWNYGQHVIKASLYTKLTLMNCITSNTNYLGSSSSEGLSKQ